MNQAKLFSTKNMIQIAFMAALLCVLAPLSIPLPITPVPLSLAVFILYLCSYLLAPASACLCVLLYLLLGIVGLPVFSKGGAGLGVLFGPTGGYLLGYLPLCFVSSYVFHRFPGKKALHLAGMFIALLICYLLGTLWFIYKKEGIDFVSALKLCVLPFITADCMKIVLAFFIGPEVLKRLHKVSL